MKINCLIENKWIIIETFFLLLCISDLQQCEGKMGRVTTMSLKHTHTHTRRKKRKPTDGWNERSSWECHCMALTRRAWIVSVQAVQWTKIHRYFVFCQLNISCPTDCSCGSVILFSFSICPFSRGEITFGLWFSYGTVVYPAVQRLARQLYKLTLGTKVWPVLDQWQCFFLSETVIHPFIWHNSNHSDSSMPPKKCS